MKNIEVYKENILSYIDKNSCKEYKQNENCVEYVSFYNNCELKISINKDSHIIDNVSVNISNDNKYIKNLMKAFCDVIIGMPILEAQDHSVLRLETLLRDESLTHTIKGVIMPTNCCELFETPLQLIRNLFLQYSEQENYLPLGNTYSPLSIKDWKNLLPEEREDIIKEKVSGFCKKRGIENYDFIIIGDMRIEFIIDKTLYESLGKLLFDMERSIGKELGFSLEVMFTEKKDANRKRKIKES